MVERRKHKRVPVARAATATYGATVGEVVDASMSGMSIIHQGPATASGEIVDIDLRYNGHSFRVPGEVVWDRAVENQGTSPAQRRCGFAFRPLAKRERYWLEHFLWSQTDGWPTIPVPDELA